MKMIRKQVYIEAAHEAKLKRLAASRHCTESEVLREAIGSLEAPLDPPIVRRLREAGLLVEYDGPPPLSEEERAKLQAELDVWCREHGPLRLSEAVLEEREESW